VSEYPTPIAAAHLARIRALAGFVRPPWVGLSDHSLGHDVAVAATAMGVVAIEKHFILQRTDGGPDAAFSMEPAEYRSMAEAVKSIHAATFGVGASPGDQPPFYRKSLYYAEDITSGTVIADGHLKCMRPNLGAHPNRRSLLIGKTAKRDLAAGTPVALDDLD
jgi:sialic acid synthase SpsE